jgi:hypothetical protein
MMRTSLSILERRTPPRGFGCRQRHKRDEAMRVKYVDYATYLLRGKIASGDLNSAKTREQWAHVQDVHLVPAFGDCSVEAIKRADIEEWKAAQGARVRRRDYSPNPVNGWLRVCMRRTFQDLRRAAQVPDFVVRAISGHATVDMQAQYSTVSGDEVRRGLAKVVSLSGIRSRQDEDASEEGESGHAGGHAGGEVDAEAAG